MAQQGIDYAKLAAQSGGAPVAPAPPPQTVFKTDTLELTAQPPVDYAALAAEAGGKPGEVSEDGRLVFKSTNEPVGQGFLKELWDNIDPRQLVEVAKDPLGAARGFVTANPRFLEEAKAAAASGDYKTALRKFLSYSSMGMGNVLDRQSELLEQGDYSSAAGSMAGLATGFAAPAVVSRAGGLLRNSNPRVAAAVAQGDAAGVPMDLATASGNPFIQNTQKVLGQTAGGSVVARRAGRRQEAALEGHGRALADDVHPSAMSPETAGAATLGGLQGRVASLSREADTAYSALRRFEEQAAPQTVQTTTMGRVAGGGEIPVTQPKQVKLAVDVRAAKAELAPVFERLQRQAKEFNVPMQGQQARAIQALDDLMRADDFASLSVVDKALGELKAIQRSLDSVDTSAANAIASAAVKALDRQVVMTARRAGPDVLKALLDGRRATVAKHVANDVLESLGGEIKAGQVVGEPVGAYRRTIQGQDAAINRLRQVARETPEAMPRIGRAVLDDLFEKATAEGGFARTDGLWRSWQSLGAETKKLLYPKPGQVQAIDNFFLLAKKMAENPNKSGTMLTGVSAAELGAMGATLGSGNLALAAKQAGFVITTAALTKIMYSPRLVRLLTTGMQLPAGSPAAVGWGNAFTRAARAEGVELVPVPVGGAEETTTSPSQKRQ